MLRPEITFDDICFIVMMLIYITGIIISYNQGRADQKEIDRREARLKDRHYRRMYH